MFDIFGRCSAKTLRLVVDDEHDLGLIFNYVDG